MGGHALALPILEEQRQVADGVPTKQVEEADVQAAACAPLLCLLCCSVRIINGPLAGRGVRVIGAVGPPGHASAGGNGLLVLVRSPIAVLGYVLRLVLRDLALSSTSPLEDVVSEV